MSSSEIKSRFNGYYNTQYDVVLFTESRKKRLTRRVMERFDALARESLTKWQGEVVSITGDADHVHLVVDLPPKTAVVNFIQGLKSGTARRLRNEFPKLKSAKALWDPSYAVFTRSALPDSAIAAYIADTDVTGNGVRSVRGG